MPNVSWRYFKFWKYSAVGLLLGRSWRICGQSFCMFMQHVHGACPCFVFKLHLHCAFSRPHVLAACTCCISKCMSMLLLHAACLCNMCMKSVPHVHVSVVCQCCMSMLYVHVACPYCMSMVHVLTAYTFWESVLHVHAACLCKENLDVYAACPCCMSMLLDHAAGPCCMSLLHVTYACPCCMSLMHVHAACPCCMSLLLIHAFWPCCLSLAACPCCMSMLHVRVVFFSVLHVRVAFLCCVFMLHFCAACSWCISNIHAACPCCLSVLHVLAECPCWMSLLLPPLLNVLAAAPLAECPCCMPLLHVHSTCPFFMAIHHVRSTYPCFMSIPNVHASFPRCSPRRMSNCQSCMWRRIPMPYILLHICATSYSACPSCMSMLLIYAAWPYLLHVHTVCTCRMPFVSMLQVFSACPCCIYWCMPMSFLFSMLRVHAACPCCMYMLHIHAACPLLVLAVCLCCVSLVKVLLIGLFSDALAEYLAVVSRSACKKLAGVLANKWKIGEVSGLQKIAELFVFLYSRYRIVIHFDQLLGTVDHVRLLVYFIILRRKISENTFVSTSTFQKNYLQFRFQNISCF